MCVCVCSAPALLKLCNDQVLHRLLGSRGCDARSCQKAVSMFLQGLLTRMLALFACRQVTGIDRQCKEGAMQRCSAGNRVSCCIFCAHGGCLKPPIASVCCCSGAGGPTAWQPGQLQPHPRQREPPGTRPRHQPVPERAAACGSAGPHACATRVGPAVAHRRAPGSAGEAERQLMLTTRRTACLLVPAWAAGQAGPFLLTQTDECAAAPPSAV